MLFFLWPVAFCSRLLIRGRDFADIVEQSGKLYVVLLHLRELHLRGDGRGIGADSLRVPLHLRVVHLERGDQGTNRSGKDPPLLSLRAHVLDGDGGLKADGGHQVQVFRLEGLIHAGRFEVEDADRLLVRDEGNAEHGVYALENHTLS